MDRDRTPPRRSPGPQGARLKAVLLGLLVAAAACVQGDGRGAETQDVRERHRRDTVTTKDTVEPQREGLYDVIVYLTSRASEDVQESNGTASNPDVEELRTLLEKHDTSLEPLHAGAEDPTLVRQFRARVQGRAAADAVAEALRDAPAVEGAYVQPPQGPPG